MHKIEEMRRADRKSRVGRMEEERKTKNFKRAASQRAAAAVTERKSEKFHFSNEQIELESKMFMLIDVNVFK